MDVLLDDINGKLADCGFTPVTEERMRGEESLQGMPCNALISEIVRHESLHGDMSAVSKDTSSVVEFIKRREYATKIDGTLQSNLLVLDFLVSEVQFYRCLALQALSVPAVISADTADGAGGDHSMADADEESTSKILAEICRHFEVVGAVGDSEAALLWKCVPLIASTLRTSKAAGGIESLIRDDLTPQHISALEEINSMLRADFSLRRQMLLQRLDVLVQSFLWSKRAEGREIEIMGEIKNRRAAMSGAPTMITASDVLSVGVDMATAVAARVTDTKQIASVKSVVIGLVPDRGGRTDEMRPKKSDLMPAWEKRKAAAAAGGGTSGGSGGSGAGPAGSAKDNGICFAHQKGNCKKGNSCRFKHTGGASSSSAEAPPSMPAAVVAAVASPVLLGAAGSSAGSGGGDKSDGAKPKGKVCFAFKKGNCARGASCKFSHD